MVRVLAVLVPMLRVGMHSYAAIFHITEAIKPEKQAAAINPRIPLRCIRATGLFVPVILQRSRSPDAVKRNPGMRLTR